MKQLNWYQIFGNVHTIPEGSTVTPTDDVQILLHCANIWDKSYTTIGEVIADDDTLFLTLIDNNAIDYLVRSTTFASSIVASESAMQYIGSYDYAVETLLSDSTWATAIGGSPYVDYVLTTSVPAMTSNTTPEGICFAGNTYSDWYPWKAFRNTVDASYAWESNSIANNYLGYQFTKKRHIYMIRTLGQNIDSITNRGIRQFKLQGSDDRNTWTDIGSTRELSQSTSIQTVMVSESNNYLAYRLLIQSNYGASWVDVRFLNFYGREIGGVQSWLKAGGITNKKYTTVSEVLSDLTTLATLMSSSDAIDYLVTAKGWATEICSDSNAMADIGMNNYAANTLLADETWLNAIANSTYRESVFNVKVPIMTSNTQPYGVASASAFYSSGNRQPYYPFSGLDNQYWCNGRAAHNDWIQYQFVSAQKIVAFTLASGAWASKDGIIKDFTLSASNDGVTFDTLGSFTSANDDILQAFSVSNSTAYSYYRITETSRYDNGDYTWVHTIQFYGRKDI